MTSLKLFLLGIAFSVFILAPIAYFNRTDIRFLVQSLVYSYDNFLLGNLTPSASIEIYENTSGPTEYRDTNSLPLVINSFDLTKVGFTPTGGHVESIGNSALLMSRTGKFYIYNGSKITQLNEQIPNNLHAFGSKFGSPGGNALRALSFSIDCSEKKIYAAYIRYEESAEFSGRYVLSSKYFDCLKNEPFGKDAWSDIFSDLLLSENEILGAHSAGGGIEIVGSFIYLAIGYPEVEGYAEDSVLTSKTQLPDAQDPNNFRGKILRISKDDHSVKIFSSGHRNLQDMYYDISTTNLIAVEQGPKGGDEINLIVEGGNYGWPATTYGTIYFSYDRPMIASLDKDGEYYDKNGLFIEPTFSFVPSAAISSVTKLLSFHESWDNNLLIGSLKGRSIFRTKVYNDRLLFLEPIWIGKPVRSIAQAGDKIIAITDDGSLLDIQPDESAFKNDKTDNDLAGNDAAFQKCTQCHGFADTTPLSSAPSLKNLFGRKIAATSFPNYSESLKSMRGNWTEDTLRGFLTTPRSIAVDSSMPNIELGTLEIERIVDKLR